MTIKQFMELVRLLWMSRQLKKKGHDLFISWSPHVSWITIQIYKNGWQKLEYNNHMLTISEKTVVRRLKEHLKNENIG